MPGIIVRLNEGDAAVDRGLRTLKETYRYDVVTQTDLNTRQDEELLAGIRGGTLVIHGHGSRLKMGGLPVSELARLLARNGLTGPVEIELYCCRGGEGGAPYALELKVELVSVHKVRCAASGARGILSRDRTTGAWSVKSDGKKTPIGQRGALYRTTKSF